MANNSRALALTLTLCAGFLTIPGAAFAQIPGNALPSGEKRVYEMVTATEIAAMVGELEIQTEIAKSASGESTFIRAQTPGGARFYIDVLACDDDAAGTGCRGVQYRAGMSNAGVSYEDLNAFNSKSIVATAYNLPANNLIGFTRYAIVSGGVRKDQLLIQLALFLKDMDNYVTEQASATSVSFDPDVNAIDNVGAASGGDNKKINPLLLSSATIVPSSEDLPNWARNSTDSTMIESAIFNTYSVRFVTPKVQRILEN